MKKIISVSNLPKTISGLKKTKKKIVLAGGCFDILHVGHIKFLNEAKSLGGVLIILLESDERVKQLKGENRPLFNQEERAYVLANIANVDYIINLLTMHKDYDYEKIVKLIKPDIIAITENDPQIEKKSVQIKNIGGRLEIIPHVKTFSTSSLAKILGIE